MTIPSEQIPVTIALDVLEYLIANHSNQYANNPSHPNRAMLIVAQNAANQARLDAEKPAPTIYPLSFASVEDRLPPENKPVLALRKSGYISCVYEVLTARHMPTYRPLSPWRDLSNDSVHDTGEPIIAWMEADALLQPK